MIKCEQCGKEVDDDDLWEWTEKLVTTCFCSRDCMDKWIQDIRPTIPVEGIEITYTSLG